MFDEVGGCGWGGGIEGQWEGVGLGRGDSGAEDGAGEALVSEMNFKLAAKGLEVDASEGGEVVAKVARSEEDVDEGVGA